MIRKVSTPLDEQETIINIAPASVVDKVNVYTSSKTMLTHMWKLYNKYPDQVDLLSDDKYGSEFAVPRDWIVVRPKRKLSEEQKKAMAERLQGYRNK